MAAAPEGDDDVVKDRNYWQKRVDENSVKIVDSPLKGNTSPYFFFVEYTFEDSPKLF